MSDYLTGTCAEDAVDGSALTIEQLQAAIASIPPLPAQPRFDLYPHDMADETQAYEFTDKTHVMPGQRDRRLLIVPRTRLEALADTLRRAGCDVRVEPRYGVEPVES